MNSIRAIPSVRNRRVIILTDARTVVPGPRVAEGTELIACAAGERVSTTGRSVIVARSSALSNGRCSVTIRNLARKLSTLDRAAFSGGRVGRTRSGARRAVAEIWRSQPITARLAGAVHCPWRVSGPLPPVDRLRFQVIDLSEVERVMTNGREVEPDFETFRACLHRHQLDFVIVGSEAVAATARRATVRICNSSGLRDLARFCTCTFCSDFIRSGCEA